MHKDPLIDQYIYVPQGRGSVITKDESIATGLYSNGFSSCCILVLQGVDEAGKNKIALFHVDWQFPLVVVSNFIATLKSNLEIIVCYRFEDVTYSNLKKILNENTRWEKVQEEVKGVGINFITKKIIFYKKNQTPQLIFHPQNKLANSLYMAYDALFIPAPSEITRMFYDGKYWVACKKIDLEPTTVLTQRIQELGIHKDNRVIEITDKLCSCSQRFANRSIDRKDAASRAIQIMLYLIGAEKKQLYCVFLRSIISSLKRQNIIIPPELEKAKENKEEVQIVVDSFLQNANKYSTQLIESLRMNKESFCDPDAAWNLEEKANNYRERCINQYDLYCSKGLTAYREKQFPSAINLYSEALKIFPKIYPYESGDSLTLFYNLGSSLFSNGQFHEALAYLEKAYNLCKIVMDSSNEQAKEKYRAKYQLCLEKVQTSKPTLNTVQP